MFDMKFDHYIKTDFLPQSIVQLRASDIEEIYLIHLKWSEQGNGLYQYYIIITAVYSKIFHIFSISKYMKILTKLYDQTNFYFH